MSVDPEIRECEKYVLAALHEWERKNKKKVTSYVFEVLEIEGQDSNQTAEVNESGN